MMNYTDRDKSFEYNPIQTEMGNYDQDKSHTSNKGSLSFQYSQYRNEQIDEEVSNCASLNSKRSNESFGSLHSLRISHSINNLKDNERTLLERMNLLRSLSGKQGDNEEDSRIILPKKNNNANKVYLENVFDCSNVDNKSVMISELDIEITNTTVYIPKEVDNAKYNRYNTVKCGTSKKTKKYFEKNNQGKGKGKEKSKGSNNNKINDRPKGCDNKKKCNEHTSCSTQNKDRKEINYGNHKLLNSNASDLIKMRTHSTNDKQKRNQNTKNNNTLLSCDSGKKLGSQKKKIYSSMKKINDKKSIYNLLNRVFIHDPRTSSLNKKTTETSTISTIANHLPQSNSSKIKILNSNNIKTYTGQSNNSTASQERSIKRSNNIPPSRLQKNTQAPYVKSFNYKESLIQKRMFSLKQKNYSQKELRIVPYIAPNKRDHSLNNTKPLSKKNSSIIIKDSHTSKSNSKTKGLKYNSTNVKEMKTTGIMNIQINNLNGTPHINGNNCDTFHTIQSISDDKIKCPHTVSTNKNKQISTKKSLTVKSNGNSKEKTKENQSPLNSCRNIHNRNIQVYHNIDYTSTQHSQYENNAKSFNNKTQLQTPINHKPNVQVYKNNIKHITITPINGLKMKMMELQQQKTKMKGKKKDDEIPGFKNKKGGGHIENNEAFFHKLLTEH